MSLQSRLPLLFVSLRRLRLALPLASVYAHTSERIVSVHFSPRAAHARALSEGACARGGEGGRCACKPAICLTQG